MFVVKYEVGEGLTVGLGHTLKSIVRANDSLVGHVGHTEDYSEEVGHYTCGLGWQSSDGLFGQRRLRIMRMGHKETPCWHYHGGT